MSLLDRIALIVVIIGAVNWGCIGLFNLDLVAFCFGRHPFPGQPRDLLCCRSGRLVVHIASVRSRMD